MSDLRVWQRLAMIDTEGMLRLPYVNRSSTTAKSVRLRSPHVGR